MCPSWTHRSPIRLRTPKKNDDWTTETTKEAKIVTTNTTTPRIDDDARAKAMAMMDTYTHTRDASQAIVDVVAQDVPQRVHRRARTQVAQLRVRGAATQRHAHRVQHLVHELI